MKYYRVIVVVLLMITFNSCKKYLDAKSDLTLSTPETLEDIQAILDNTSILNRGTIYSNDGADDYYVPSFVFGNRPLFQKQSFLWEPELDDIIDWTQQYNIIFYANTALFNLERINTSGQESKSSTLKGSALFYRAFAFYNLTQLFSPQYDPATAKNDLGIPLRLTADFNDPSTRSSVEEAYSQILKDIEEAIPLLPATTSIKTRPSKNACYALLARVYLQMGSYAKALESATQSIQLNDKLLNFNASPIDLSPASLVPRFNEEVIFHANNDQSLVSNAVSLAPLDFYQSYSDDDLRKAVYFRALAPDFYRFKGSYAESLTDVFTGLANDEIYLIRAECYAREGKVTEAMFDLNTLMENRWSSGAFVPFTAADAEDALVQILIERKKELIFRGVRWSDLRRLNKDDRFKQTIVRELDGSTLPPDDLRYTLLIPQAVIILADLPQNPR